MTPVPDNVGVLQMERVPDRIKSFYRVNNICRFRYDRPFHKGPKDRDNEFKVRNVDSCPGWTGEDTAADIGTHTRSCCCCVFQSLWIERTTLILTHPLPGISPWFEVEKRELVRGSSIVPSPQTDEDHAERVFWWVLLRWR